MLFDPAFWSGVGASAVTGIITSSLVAGVVQVVFKARYDQRLESLKGRLTAENAREIERFKAESTIAAERFKKSYGLLAERQAEIVEEMYRLLTETYVALHSSVAPFRPAGAPSKEELFSKFLSTRWDAYHYFLIKRLFFPSELSTQIDAIMARMMEQGATYEAYAIYMSRENADWEKLREVWEETKGPIQETLRELEAKFRQLLQGESI